MKGNNFFKNNWFLLTMVLGMVAGAITGAVWPGATCLEPLGTIFINMIPARYGRAPPASNRWGPSSST